MNSRAGTNLAKCREKVQAPLRLAWVDRVELLKAPEPLFWERIISLSNIGYRIQ